jgi:hypothetical protein
MKAVGTKVFFAGVILLGCAVPIRAGAETKEVSPVSVREVEKAKPVSLGTFFDMLNNTAYADEVNEDEEREMLRGIWEQALGVDIFYPYFQAKKVEDFVKERTHINIFSYSGSAEFDDDTVQYIFKKRF